MMKPDIKKKINHQNPHKVKELLLENGRLSGLPPELIKFDKLKVLSLFNNRLTELPDFFKNFTSLNFLNLSNNRFINLPEQLTFCKNLKTLILKGNRINNLIGLNELSQTLEKIDLSSNKLDTLRIDFSNFTNLKDIDLSDNQIQKFPKSLLNERIKKLKLSSNKFSKLPNEIRKMNKIIYLDLSFNEITELPEEICELTELRTLDLTGNKLVSLPKDFAKLCKLQTLNLNGNPIGDVPIEISNQGLKGVLNYYLHIGVSVKLNEAKLLLVGQGAVGKTYLLNKMITGDTPEISTTEGIDIRKWNIPYETEDSKNQNIRLNAWDFGGQEIYHSTHQFFLTKRSIYLFIWEARKDESQINFDYWLNIIKILSNSSPVIVVLNKIDERAKLIDEKSLKEKFPNIKAFKSVSAIEGTNVSELVESIKNNVLELPHIGDKLPKVWSEIREELESIEDNYITYEKYIEICNSYGQNKPQSKQLAKYFNDLGVFLHFNDNIILRPVVFLKPEWATNCVYKILDLHEVINNFGEFNSELLDKYLDDYNSQQISYIIELMKKFELCFEFKRNRYIIPELLKTSSPEVELEKDDGICFVYKYDFMPAGILPRLIVRLQDLIYGNHYWKSGVYVENDGSIGCVTSNQFARTIKIDVYGSSSANLLAIIRRELDYINATLNYPHYEMKILCNCNNCLRSDEPYMFDYEFLEKAKRAKRTTVTCQHNIKEVDLMKLIGPYEIKYDQIGEDFRFNSTDLTYDIIEISSRLLERKHTHKIEDLITDSFTDNLRSKGYRVSDQTRSGRSLKLSGELDIMIRNLRNMPVSILEAMKLGSFGMGNTSIINHLNKLLIDYDTNGLARNFMLIYAKSDNFSDFWLNYKEYIENLPSHFLYNPEAKLVSFNVNNELSSRSNIKVLVTQHERTGVVSEVYHIILNMD